MERQFVPPAHTRARGRWLLWLGMLVFLIGPVAYFVQVGMKQLTVPWYALVLGTAGIALLVLSVVRRPTVLRIVVLVVFALLYAGEWLFLFPLTRMPAYTGPAQAGQKLPAFTAVRADGSFLTEKDFEQGSPSVLVFFRGRW